MNHNEQDESINLSTSHNADWSSMPVEDCIYLDQELLTSIVQTWIAETYGFQVSHVSMGAAERWCDNAGEVETTIYLTPDQDAFALTQLLAQDTDLTGVAEFVDGVERAKVIAKHRARISTRQAKLLPK